MPKQVQVEGIGTVEFGDEFSPAEIKSQVGKLYEQKDRQRQDRINAFWNKLPYPLGTRGRTVPVPTDKELMAPIGPAAPTEIPEGIVTPPAEALALAGKATAATAADIGLTLTGNPTTENLQAVEDQPLREPLPAEKELADLESLQGAAAKGVLGVARTAPAMAVGTIMAPVVSPYVSYPAAFGTQTYGETGDPAAARKSAAIATLFPLVGKAVQPVATGIAGQMVKSGMIKAGNETAQKAVEAAVHQAAFNTAAQIVNLPDYLEAETPAEAKRIFVESLVANTVFAIPEVLGIPNKNVPAATRERLAKWAEEEWTKQHAKAEQEPTGTLKPGDVIPGTEARHPPPMRPEAEAEREAAREARQAEIEGTAPPPPQLVVGREPGPGEYRVTDETLQAEIEARTAPVADPNAPIGSVRVPLAPAPAPPLPAPPVRAPEPRAELEVPPPVVEAPPPVLIQPGPVLPIRREEEVETPPAEPTLREPAYETGQPTASPPGVDVREPTGAGAPTPPREETPRPPGGEAPAGTPTGGRAEEGREPERGGRVRGRGRPGAGAERRPGERGGPGPAAGPAEGTAGNLPKPGIVEAPRTTETPRPTTEADINHVLPAGEDWIPSGDKAKAQANIEAIKLLRTLEAENRNPTPEEKTILARYTGWGGLQGVFDEGKAAYRQRPGYTEQQKTEAANWERNWGKLYDEVKVALTPEEHAAAARSIRNAHYTSRDVINAIWQGVQRLGFKGGNALEPAAGVGNFIGLTPEGLRGKVRWNAVELDSVSARLAAKLYPEARVQEAGFESARLSPNSQDLVISNVPFAADGPIDKRYPRMSLHNYFFARALDVAKPGGIVAAITSDSTMDNAASRQAREYFASKADLVGAIRLPNTAFKKNAGTEVTTDILFFRKRDDRPFQGEPFLRAVPAETYNGEPIQLNEYYVAHPEMMLGRMSVEGTMYREGQQALLPTPGANLPTQLQEAIAKLPENVMGQRAAVTEAAPTAYAERGAKIGRLSFREGIPQLPQPDGTVARPDWAGDAKKVKQAQAYVTVRDAASKLLAEQLSTEATEAQMAESRKALNTAYDAYVKKHGAINERRSQFLDDDVDFPLALALEDAQTKLVESGGKARRETTWTKSKLFTERTIFPRTPPQRVDTVGDALQVSLNFAGKVDPDYMAKLTGRPADSVKSELQATGQAFENPETGQWESRASYLSGFVKAKLEKARSAAEADPRFARQVAELEKVQPPPIAIENIGVRLGSTFVPPEVIQNFIRDTLDVQARVNYTPQTGDWTVTPTAGQHTEKNRTLYGIHDWGGHELVEQSLNLKSATVYDEVRNDEGQMVKRRNAAKSLEAQQKQARLQEEFKQYALKDPQTAKALEQIYNDRYNGVVAPKFDAPTWAHYPGADQSISLREHQKAVVSRMLQNSTLLAHAVGTGKTYAMTTAAMEMRRLGLARKPMIVVQNATLEQFARSFKRLYPSARILVPNAKQRDAQNRNKTMSRIATGDWDAVIIPQSFVNMLPDDPARVEKQLSDRKAELVEAEIEARREEGRTSIKAKDLQKAIERLDRRLSELADRKKDQVMTFEQLGVDALFVDEAHAYKKLEFTTKMENIKGLDVGASQRGFSMMMKARWVQDKNQGRNVVFATGTPVSNTIAEAWNMMRYLRPDVLKAYDIEKFDDFASTFGDTVTQLEMTPGGTWKPVTRFARYTNGPELISAWRTVADVVTPEEVNLPGLPALKNGRTTVHNIPQSPALKNYVGFLRSELERFAAMSGKEKRENSHIPLVVFGLAKKASLDMRMIDPTLEDQPGSKLNVAADTIARIYNDSTPVKGAQMVFSDAFQDNPENPRFNLYQELKKKLIERGVPENQIAIITSEIKDARREALFTKVNDGDLRVVLGSTERMGVGVNAQEHLIGLHHLDAPPRPMDIEQRNGRILRQGNQNTEVEVHSYGVENTLDAAMFQKLATKQKFINQILRGDIQGRNFEDAANEQSLSFEEQMAAFAGDKRAMEKVGLDNQVRQLEALRRGHFEQVRQARDTIVKLQTATIPYQEKQAVEAQRRAPVLAAAFGPDAQWVLKAGKETTEGRKEVIEALDKVLKAGLIKTVEYFKKHNIFGQSGATDLGSIQLNGQPIDLTGTGSADAKGIVNPESMNVSWRFRDGGMGGQVRTGTGFMTSLQSALERVGSEVDRTARSVENERRNLRELEGFVTQPFQREAELADAKTKLAALTAELEAEGTGHAPEPEPAAPEEPGEEEHGFSSSKPLTQAFTEDLARFRNAVAPQTAGGEARFAGNLLRELNAKMANELARADVALRPFRNSFDRTPLPKDWTYDPTVPLPRNLAFIDAYESGNVSHLPPVEQKAAAEFHRLNSADVARVQALGVGALQRIYANYFPHLWDDPVRAANVFAKLLAKRPLEGPASFLKKRTHELFVEGLAAGLKPVHDNPVDLWLLKKREVERFIMGNEFVKEMREAGQMKFKYVFAKAPDGWQTVNDKAFAVYGPPTVTIKEAFDAGMRQATLDVLKNLGVPHERLARLGRQWGKEIDVPGQPGTERIQTKFAGPDFVMWHELGHALHNRYADLEPTLTATPVMETELRALADARLDPTSSAAQGKYVRKMTEKMATVLQAYLHAPAEFARIAPTVKTAFEAFLKAHPELQQINDIRPSLRLGEGEAQLTHGGLLKLGDWIMPDQAAQVVNNFLSPGLNTHLWYRTLRETGNLLNGVQLGLSAFHLGFTSLDAATSRLAVALEDAAHGNIGKALLTAASVPLSPFTNIAAGAKLRSEVLKPGSYPQMAELAKALESAGGRVGMDAFWQTNFTRRMQRAWHAGGLQFAKAIGLAPFAAWEQTMRPILEYVVPRQKLGVFADMAKRELLRLGPAASPADVRETMRKAWDSVDNRMGQVVYDNLFYNRTVKDVALLAFRAYGWQLGKYREGIGAVVDFARAAGKVAHGERPEFTHRMAYAIALPLMVGTIGGFIHYMMTGRKPEEAIDYFQPQTGELDRNGNPVRLNLPSYVKDAIGYRKSPVTAFGHSLHPMISGMFDLLQNKDFYNVQIRNPDDPLWRQGSDVAKFAGSQFVPFSISGGQKLAEEGAPAWKRFAPYFGVTPVPTRLTMTPAQELSSEIMSSMMPSRPRTREQADESKLLREVIDDLKKGQGESAAAKLSGIGSMTPQQMRVLVLRAGYTPMQFQVHMMSVPDAVRVWSVASPQERASLGPILAAKLSRVKNLTPATIKALQGLQKQ